MTQDSSFDDKPIAGSTELSLDDARRLLYTAPVGVLIFQRDRIVLINEVGAALLGGTPDSLMNQPLSLVRERIHPDDVEMVRGVIERVRTGEQVPSITHRLLRPDGTLRWVDAHCSRTRYAVSGALRVVFYDVTDRQVATENLGTVAGQLRAIADSALDSIFCKDTERRYTFVNRAMCEVFGVTPDVLLGRTPEELLDPESAQTIRQVDEANLRGEKVDATRPVRVDDGERVFHTIQVPMRNDAGAIVGIAGIVRDVTEQSEARAALNESNERYRALVEASPNAIIVHSNGVALLVNGMAARLLGAESPDDLVGRTIWDHIAPEFHDIVRQRVSAIYRGNQQAENVEVKMLRCDGSAVWVEAAAGPVMHDGSKASQVIFRDITSRRAAEEQREQLEAQLLQAQKLEAIGRLAGGIAHDFNNLLTEISGNASLALMSMSPNDPNFKYFDAINDASRRAAALTHQLLAFSRKTVFQPTPVAIDRLIVRMEGMLSRLLDSDVEFVTDLHAAGVSVMADASQLEQVLLNLCINARDAMPNGGRLTVSTRATNERSQFCKACPENHSGRFMRLTVTDTGIGMDQQTLAHIFEPFFTTKSKDKGTGLGLSTTYGIVQQHGGSIHVSSQVGEGTTFQICFPCTDGTSLAMPAPTQPVIARGRERVLLVEDEPVVKEVTSAILERLGYEVVSASSPLEALEILPLLDPPPKLLLTDVIMPQMNGRELAEKVVRRLPGIKVLFTSGYSKNIINVDGEGKSPNFIGKPYTPRALSLKVRQVLDSND